MGGKNKGGLGASRVGSGIEGSDDIRRFGALRLERIIADMVGGIIGRRVALHELLGPEEYHGQSENNPEAASRSWGPGAGPFCAAFLSHHFVSEYSKITINSQGSLGVAGGGKADFRMELSLDRICVPPTSAALKWRPGTAPLVVEWGNCPVVISESAFSFDVEEDEALPGLQFAGCGFIALADAENVDPPFKGGRITA